MTGKKRDAEQHRGRDRGSHRASAGLPPEVRIAQSRENDRGPAAAKKAIADRVTRGILRRGGRAI